VPIRSRLGRPSRIVAAVFFLACLVVAFTAFNGLPAPAAGLTAGAAASAEETADPTPGAAVAGPTQVVHALTANPNVDAAAAPRQTPFAPSPRLTPTPVPTPAPLGDLTGYVWPLKGRLTLGFEHSGWASTLVQGERFHDGIDIATFCGDRIRAAHGGIVLAAGRHFDDYVGWIGDLKPYYRRLTKKDLWDILPIAIVIDDGNGYRSIYAHFSKVRVKAGDVVKAGQLIGLEGDTGRASGCHLHYGLFSPYETKRFELHPDSAKRMKLPRWEVARANPLLVLPYRKGISPASVRPKD
jgi:murein DD-endopeptidase MepM/ murein hydrolase activator NlpD